MYDQSPDLTEQLELKLTCTMFYNNNSPIVEGQN